VLLDHLATIKDTRQSWKVAYPLREVLFLVVCGTIASGDDYDDIVDRGEAQLSFLLALRGAHGHEPDRSGAVRSLLFVLGRRSWASRPMKSLAGVDHLFKVSRSGWRDPRRGSPRV
jgi:DDE_Tnp_1-associated